MEIPQKSNGDNYCTYHCALADGKITYHDEELPNYLISITKTNLNIDQKDIQKRKESPVTVIITIMMLRTSMKSTSSYKKNIASFRL